MYLGIPPPPHPVKHLDFLCSYTNFISKPCVIAWPQASPSGGGRRTEPARQGGRIPAGVFIPEELMSHGAKSCHPADSSSHSQIKPSQFSTS